MPTKGTTGSATTPTTTTAGGVSDATAGVDTSTSASLRRQRNPRGQGDQLRRDLIDAATRLFERGATEDELSLRAVAREAGLRSTTSVYLHFTDREALLWAVLTTHYTDLYQHGMAAAATATTPVQKLKAWCHTYCAFAEQRPGPYRLLFGTVPRTVPDRSPEQLPGNELWRALVAAVEDCIDHAEARPPTPDVQLTTTTLWTALHGIATLRLTRPAFPWPPLTVLIDTTLSGLVGITEPVP